MKTQMIRAFWLFLCAVRAGGQMGDQPLNYPYAEIYDREVTASDSAENAYEYRILVDLSPFIYWENKYLLFRFKFTAIDRSRIEWIVWDGYHRLRGDRIEVEVKEGATAAFLELVERNHDTVQLVKDNHYTIWFAPQTVRDAENKVAFYGSQEGVVASAQLSEAYFTWDPGTHFFSISRFWFYSVHQQGWIDTDIGWVNETFSPWNYHLDSNSWFYKEPLFFGDLVETDDYFYFSQWGCLYIPPQARQYAYRFSTEEWLYYSKELGEYGPLD